MPKLSKDNNIPNAINRLKIIPALTSCCPTGVVNCIDKTNDAEVFVYDDKNLGYSDWNNNSAAVTISKCFIAKNPKKTEITLLPLDNRLVQNTRAQPTLTEGGITDCAIATDQELCFIEFKTNATSRKNIRRNSNKAEKQLWHTYDSIIKPKCLNQGVDLSSSVTIEFYIVFDTAMGVTGAMASCQARMIKFATEHSGALLFFDNEKEFV